MALLQESMKNFDMNEHLADQSQLMDQSIYLNEGLSEFLLSSSLKDRSLCSFLYWYIKVEQEYGDKERGESKGLNLFIL